MKTSMKSDRYSGKLLSHEILALIKENPQLTISQIATICKVSRQGVYYHIEKLKDLGLLERLGGTKGGKWICKI